jgi:hypothetical protein
MCPQQTRREGSSIGQRQGPAVSGVERKGKGMQIFALRYTQDDNANCFELEVLSSSEAMETVDQDVLFASSNDLEGWPERRYSFKLFDVLGIDAFHPRLKARIRGDLMKWQGNVIHAGLARLMFRTMRTGFTGVLGFSVTVGGLQYEDPFRGPSR